MVGYMGYYLSRMDDARGETIEEYVVKQDSFDFAPGPIVTAEAIFTACCSTVVSGP